MRRTNLRRSAVVGCVAFAACLFFLAARPTFPRPRHRFLEGSRLLAHAVVGEGALETYVFQLPLSYPAVASEAQAELTSFGYSVHEGRNGLKFYKDDLVVIVEAGRGTGVSVESGLPRVDEGGAGSVATFRRYRHSLDSRSTGGGM